MLDFHHYLGHEFLVGEDLPAALATQGRTGAYVEAHARQPKAFARRACRELTSDEIRWRVAVHETGHVVVGRDAGGQAELMD